MGEDRGDLPVLCPDRGPKRVNESSAGLCRSEVSESTWCCLTGVLGRRPCWPPGFILLGERWGRAGRVCSGARKRPACRLGRAASPPVAPLGWSRSCSSVITPVEEERSELAWPPILTLRAAQTKEPGKHGVVTHPPASLILSPIHPPIPFPSHPTLKSFIPLIFLRPCVSSLYRSSAFAVSQATAAKH